MSDATRNTPSPADDFSPEAKAEMRRWIERWKLVGPILDEDRWQRLRESSEEELARQALDVLGLWRADLPGDDGAALIIQQQIFRKMTTPPDP